jgi:DNA polymerase
VPFVGRSGQRLDAAIVHLQLTPPEFGVLNLLKCRPPNNRFDRDAAQTCRPYLDRQIALLAPQVLVTLGSPALHALDPAAAPILRVAGQPRTGPYGPLFPLIHPAAAMRSRRMTERWNHDVDALGHWLAHRPAQPV